MQVGDIISTVGVFSTMGDILSTVGVFSTVGLVKKISRFEGFDSQKYRFSFLSITSFPCA